MLTGRWRPFAGILAAQACAISAARLLMLAVPWMILSGKGTATEAGIVMALQATPYAVLRWLGRCWTAPACAG